MAKKQIENNTSLDKEVKKKSIEDLKFDVQSEDLTKWDFNKNSLFVGYYKRKEHFKFDEKQADGTTKPKEFDLYVFEDFESGERFHIDSCHSIQKYIEDEISNKVDFSKVVYAIQFLGKTTVKNRPLNQFTISKATV